MIIQATENEEGDVKMPYIDARITVKLSGNEKEEIKTELGKMISVIDKDEAYLMVGINDSYDLWMGGRKLKKGAYVEVSMYGNTSKDACSNLTGRICELLGKKLEIPGDAIYVTYHPIQEWGWNGINF